MNSNRNRKYYVIPSDQATEIIIGNRTQSWPYQGERNEQWELPIHLFVYQINEFFKPQQSPIHRKRLLLRVRVTYPHKLTTNPSFQ
jgi:hypothetical protein